MHCKRSRKGVGPFESTAVPRARSACGRGTSTPRASSRASSSSATPLERERHRPSPTCAWTHLMSVFDFVCPATPEKKREGRGA